MTAPQAPCPQCHLSSCCHDVTSGLVTTVAPVLTMPLRVFSPWPHLRLWCHLGPCRDLRPLPRHHLQLHGHEATSGLQAAARPQAAQAPQAALPWRRLRPTGRGAASGPGGAAPPPPHCYGDSGRKPSAGAPEVPGVAEAEAAAVAAVSFWAVTPGRHHGGRGLAGAAGLGAHRALAAAHVREGAGAGKRGPVPGRAGRCRARYRLQAACARRRWATSRCRPPWAGTSSAARSTSCPGSSPTVSRCRRLPPPQPAVAGGGPRGGPGRGGQRVLRGVTGPRCPQPSTS